jgi:hypothetical protein
VRIAPSGSTVRKRSADELRDRVREYVIAGIGDPEATLVWTTPRCRRRARTRRGSLTSTAV